jgi:hypothetical protein
MVKSTTIGVRDGSYHTRCLQAVRASRMVGCRRDGCAESIDRRRRGIRRRGAIADELGEMHGGKPFRCVRDVRGVTRRATPSTRDANARVDASSCTPHPMRVATGIARHDRGRGRDARRARPTRESNETFSPPSDRVRARRVPSLRASTAPPVASRRAGGRAPVCFFCVATSENFCASRRVRRHRWRVPGPPSVECAHASRADHEPRVSRYDRAIASMTSIPRRSATRCRARDADADADATRVESRACANARIRLSSRRARVERISRVTVREPSHRGWVPDRGLCSSRARVPIPRVGGYIHGSRPVVFGFDFSHFFVPTKTSEASAECFRSFSFRVRVARVFRTRRRADRRRSTRTVTGIDRERIRSTRTRGVRASNAVARRRNGRVKPPNASGKTRREEIPDDERTLGYATR